MAKVRVAGFYIGRVMQIVGYVYIQAAAATLSRRRDLHSEELWNAVRTSRTCNRRSSGYWPPKFRDF